MSLLYSFLCTCYIFYKRPCERALKLSVVGCVINFYVVETRENLILTSERLRASTDYKIVFYCFWLEDYNFTTTCPLAVRLEALSID